LYYEEEENSGHVVALVYAGGVVDFGVFLHNFDFHFAVVVEIFNNLDKGDREPILASYLA
jgi:hypothetical protein